METENQRISNLETEVHEHTKAIQQLQIQLHESINNLKQGFEKKLDGMMERFEVFLYARLQSLLTNDGNSSNQTTIEDPSSLVNQVCAESIQDKISIVPEMEVQLCAESIEDKVNSLPESDYSLCILANNTVIGAIDAYKKEFHVASKVFDKISEPFGYIVAINPKPPDNYNTQSDRIRGIVTHDHVTPLLNQWTYQTMVHKLVGIQDNKVNEFHQVAKSNQNIQIIEDFNAKLSDFGLARQGPVEGLSHISTSIVGTVGYAAPEYVQTGRLTAKSDVWSFEVVLYELITGKRAVERNFPRSEQKLLEWVIPYVSDSKKFNLIVDPRLGGLCCIKLAQELASLANRCLMKKTKSRPKMSKVVVVLGIIICETIFYSLYLVSHMHLLYEFKLITDNCCKKWGMGKFGEQATTVTRFDPQLKIDILLIGLQFGGKGPPNFSVSGKQVFVTMSFGCNFYILKLLIDFYGGVGSDENAKVEVHTIYEIDILRVCSNHMEVTNTKDAQADELYELAEIPHGIEFLSRTTLIQLLSFIIINSLAESILRSRLMMISGRFLSKENVFMFIDESSVRTVISTIDGRLWLLESHDVDEYECALEALGNIGSSIQGSTLILSSLPPAARHVVNVAFDLQQTGTVDDIQYYFPLTIFSFFGKLVQVGYALTTAGFGPTPFRIKVANGVFTKACFSRKYPLNIRVVCAASSATGSSSSKNDFNPYEVLGVSPIEEFDMVKAAYARKCKDAEIRGDDVTAARLEKAYEKVMMAQLTNWKKDITFGSFKVSKDIKYADKQPIVPWGPITEDGTIHFFGSDTHFCLDPGEQHNELQPRAIQSFKRKAIHVVRIYAGDEHVVALDSKEYIHTWGKGYCGALGHGDETDKTAPELVDCLKRKIVVQVCVSERKTFVLADNGCVYEFGWMGFGSLGFPYRGASDKILSPRVLDSLKGHHISQVSTGLYHTIVVTNHGRIFGFGDNDSIEFHFEEHELKIDKKQVLIFDPGGQFKNLTADEEFRVLMLFMQADSSTSSTYGTILSEATWKLWFDIIA